MAIDLSQEVRKQLRASIKRYALENLEQDIGDLKADMLLEYFLKEIGPTVYNQGRVRLSTSFEITIRP